MKLNPLGIPCFDDDQLRQAMGNVPSIEDILDPFQLAMLEVQPEVEEWANETDWSWVNSVWLPPLMGKTIVEHYEYIANELLAPIIDTIEQLVKNRVISFDIEEAPIVFE